MRSELQDVYYSPTCRCEIRTVHRPTCNW